MISALMRQERDARLASAAPAEPVIPIRGSRQIVTVTTYGRICCRAQRHRTPIQAIQMLHLAPRRLSELRFARFPSAAVRQSAPPRP
jgi:hypothetical protein